MSEKKARGRRRALRRSQGNSRLSRKVASVQRSETERELDRLLGEARKERDDAREAANTAFTKAAKKLDEDRKAAIRAAEESYLEKRDSIIRRLSAQEQAAA